MNGLQLTLDRNQRWLFDKSKYRLLPPEAIRPADYEIPEIPDDRQHGIHPCSSVLGFNGSGAGASRAVPAR